MCDVIAGSRSSSSSHIAHRPGAAAASTALRSLACGIGSSRPIGNAMATVVIGNTTAKAITAVRGNASNATSQPMNSATASAATGSTA